MFFLGSENMDSEDDKKKSNVNEKIVVRLLLYVLWVSNQESKHRQSKAHVYQT